MFFYLAKPLFLGFLQFKSNFVRKQNGKITRNTLTELLWGCILVILTFLLSKFQEISGVRLKNLLVEIFSVFQPCNVAMATTTAVMKATKGIVVSEVFCESRVELIVHRNPLACCNAHRLTMQSCASITSIN